MVETLAGCPICETDNRSAFDSRNWVLDAPEEFTPSEAKAWAAGWDAAAAAIRAEWA